MPAGSKDIALRLQLPVAVSSRLVSLDVFRGATIAAMLLVNDPGDERAVYWPLRHAAWNGWTPTDLIFPFFLFIVGVSMAFSIPSRLRRNPSRIAELKHVLQRGMVLFATGLLLNGMLVRFDFSIWRIYGVLQRIAICYVICAFLTLWCRPKLRITVAVACLLGYWILIRYVPVPGLGIPTHDIPLLDPDRNLAAWLDQKLLAGRLYDGTHDPEGLLSTLPAIATTLFGLLTGKWLRSEHSSRAKAIGMALVGLLMLGSGQFWSLWLPINKNLWTSSYAVLTAGMALLILSACYVLIDVRQQRRPWAMPFLVFGMNAIAAYVLGSILAIALHLSCRRSQSAGSFISGPV